MLPFYSLCHKVAVNSVVSCSRSKHQHQFNGLSVTRYRDACWKVRFLSECQRKTARPNVIVSGCNGSSCILTLHSIDKKQKRKNSTKKN